MVWEEQVLSWASKWLAIVTQCKMINSCDSDTGLDSVLDCCILLHILYNSYSSFELSPQKNFCGLWYILLFIFSQKLQWRQVLLYIFIFIGKCLELIWVCWVCTLSSCFSWPWNFVQFKCDIRMYIIYMNEENVGIVTCFWRKCEYWRRKCEKCEDQICENCERNCEIGTSKVKEFEGSWFLKCWDYW